MSKIAISTDVSQARNISDILAASRTDWDTILAPVSVELPGGVIARAEGYRAAVRPDTGETLGIVGPSFKPNHHRDQLSQLQPLLDSGFLQAQSVAVWDGGGRIAYQFRVPELDVSISRGDTVSPLLTLAFGLDGTFSDRTFLARFRWFCKNQMGQVRDASRGLTVRHVGENDRRYADHVQNHVRSLAGQVGQEAQVMRRMMAAPLKGADLLGFFAESLGAPDAKLVVKELYDNRAEPKKNRGFARNVVDMVQDYRSDDGGAPLSVWHAFNGVTRYVTHTEGRSDAGRSARAVLGSPVTERAWDLAARLAA